MSYEHPSLNQASHQMPQIVAYVILRYSQESSLQSQKSIDLDVLL